MDRGYRVIDVTRSVRQWICCSHDLWARWFAAREDGVSEFSGVELALLSAMVLESRSLSPEGLSSSRFFERLFVSYAEPIEDQTRQVCVVQRAGNVFCRSQRISVPAKSKLHVESIDTMGTMGNGMPLVEVKFGAGYFLESPDRLDFCISPG